MPSTAVVSSVAEGSARSLDLHEFELSYQGGASRSGYPTQSNNLLISTSNNWGLAGPAPALNVVNNTTIFQFNNGCVGMNVVIPWCITRPINRFAWPIGRFTIEAVLSWSNNAVVGLENGLFCPWIDFGQIVTGVDEGFGFYNDGGTLKFASRSPGLGFETVVIANSNPTTEWNKVAFVMQNATKDKDATMTLYVNDLPVVIRTNAQFQFSGKFWLLPLMGVKSAAGLLRFYQVGTWASPDTDVGA
jgi:hypothetical protein